MRFLLALFGLFCALGGARAERADDLRAMLATLRLPPHFAIELYALAPDARGLAVSPDGKFLVVGSRGEHFYKIPIQAERPVQAEIFAPEQKLTLPTGPCFAPDGTLFIANFDKILRFDPAAGGLDERHPTEIVGLGGLQPLTETNHNHGHRVCRIGPDGKLYVVLGQPSNVPTPGEQARYEKYGMGGILRFDRDGKNREIFAQGLRNSVGLEFAPDSGLLWFTDNQVDGMGDDTPPEELNKAASAGQNFGFPWYGGGHVRTKAWADQTPPADVVFPEVELDAHAADLGLIFYRGAQFPEDWRGIFIAQHGSWNRREPIGARVMFLPYRDGKAGKPVPFLEGFNTGRTPFLGRPADVAEAPDGALFLSDDANGAVYRVFYRKP